ncbi:phage late control D family protein [Nonomuraea endophytica]|uniref:phage late control D family protein n=1 Tax=Nonomuraea endophytica TaxID=714136 RepID=UPI0037C541E8
MMIKEIVRLRIDGRPQDDLVPDLVDVAVDEAVDQADVVRLRLAVTRRLDGAWTYLDDQRFALWRRLTVEVGYAPDTEILFDGYLTHSSVYFTVDEDPYLEISGMDATVLMNLQERQRPWPNRPDHEIARDVFTEHGLSSVVEDTLVQQTEQVAVTVQNETDIQFLRRLAHRNGFECRVRAGIGYFRSPDLGGAPQKLLSMGYGAEANLASLTVSMDGTPATEPRIRRVDPMSKREDAKTLADLPERRLGASTLRELRTGLPGGGFLLTRRAPSSPSEMDAWLRAAHQRAGRFVRVQGEIDSRAYRASLRPGRPVVIKAVGERHSGTYYVSRATHTFTVDGYRQTFEAYRNALGVTGAEDFSPPAVLEPIAPGGGGASRRDGNRVLPARQVSTVLPGGGR